MDSWQWAALDKFVRLIVYNHGVVYSGRPNALAPALAYSSDLVTFSFNLVQSSAICDLFAQLLIQLCKCFCGSVCLGRKLALSFS